eukprot:symbB.v1.2.009803.t1/scaffold614.1/size180566/13
MHAGAAGKPSTTELRYMARAVEHGSLSLLCLRICTGRRHQIRSHLAFKGHPVVHDATYSSYGTLALDKSLSSRNVLHRYSLTFAAESGDPQSVERSCPVEVMRMMVQVFSRCKGNAWLHDFLRDGLPNASKPWSAELRLKLAQKEAHPSPPPGPTLRLLTPDELQVAVARAIRPDGRESRLYGALLAVAMGWWHEVHGDEKLFANALGRAAIAARRELGALDVSVRPTPLQRIRQLWDEGCEEKLKASGAVFMDLDPMSGFWESVAELCRVAVSDFWRLTSLTRGKRGKVRILEAIERFLFSALLAMLASYPLVVARPHAELVSRPWKQLPPHQSARPVQESSFRSGYFATSAAALVAAHGTRKAKLGRRASTIQIDHATSSDLPSAADVAVRSLRWTEGFLDTPNFSEEDYALLSGREAPTYQALYLSDNGYPSTFLVAKLRGKTEKKESSWFDFGGSGGSSKVVGCVGCEVKCFNRFTNEELPTMQYDGGKQTVLRPVMADLAVSPDCRGKGVGRKLVEKLEAVVREWGYDELVLLVEATNFQARGVYERLNYRLSGIRPAEAAFLDKSDGSRRVAERKTVALLLRKSLKPFPQGDLENLNWGAVLTLLGLGLALSQAPDLVAVLQSNVLRFFA